mgnify:CR=1 FL=1
MSFLFSVAQLLGWIMVGYNVAHHNNWAVASFVLGNIVLGLVQAINAVGKEMKNGSTSKSN